jgi:hypothetical protein
MPDTITPFTLPIAESEAEEADEEVEEEEAEDWDEDGPLSTLLE